MSNVVKRTEAMNMIAFTIIGVFCLGLYFGYDFREFREKQKKNSCVVKGTVVA